MLRYFLCSSYCFLLVWTSPLQNKPTAYLNNNRVSGRIINGERATVGQFPWQVQMFTSFGNWFITCGGALISDEWIVTTAQCIDGAVNTQVYMGAVSYDSIPMMSFADTFIVHEGYNSSTSANDIGLVRLKKRLLIDENTAPIGLSSKPLESGVEVTVSGFGEIEEGDITNQYLYYVTVTTVDNSQCSQVYGESIVDSMVCTDAGDPAKGICISDVGSPAVVYDTDNNPLLVAVAEFFSGRGCESGDPSGFTKVADYVDWIKDKTGF